MKDEQIEQIARRISIDRAAINHGRILADAEAAIETAEPTDISQTCTVSWFRRRWFSGCCACRFLLDYLLCTTWTKLRSERTIQLPSTSI